MKNLVTGQAVQTFHINKSLCGSASRSEHTYADDVIDQKDFVLAKTNQLLWFGIHLIGMGIGLRFLFLLFGANLRGIALIIYNLTTPFVQPFQGIFSTPQGGGAYVDSAALLALALWYLFGTIVTYILTLLSNDTSDLG